MNAAVHLGPHEARRLVSLLTELFCWMCIDEGLEASFERQRVGGCSFDATREDLGGFIDLVATRSRG